MPWLTLISHTLYGSMIVSSQCKYVPVYYVFRCGLYIRGVEKCKQSGMATRDERYRDDTLWEAGLPDCARFPANLATRLEKKNRPSYEPFIRSFLIGRITMAITLYGVTAVVACTVPVLPFIHKRRRNIVLLFYPDSELWSIKYHLFYTYIPHTHTHTRKHLSDIYIRLEIWPNLATLPGQGFERPVFNVAMVTASFLLPLQHNLP